MDLPAPERRDSLSLPSVLKLGSRSATWRPARSSTSRATVRAPWDACLPAA